MGPAYVKRLRALREEREAAQSQADQALQAICRLVPDAYGAGLSITEIARYAGISRQTLYARGNARNPTPAHRPDRHTASRAANPPGEATAEDPVAG